MYSTLETVKIIEFYETKNSVLATQLKLNQQFNICCSPSFKIIKSIVVNFKTKGLVLNQQKGCPMAINYL